MLNGYPPEYASYYDGGYRYAQRHPSADMPGLFSAFHIVTIFEITDSF